MVISKQKSGFFISCTIVTFFCLRMESIQYLTPFGELYLEIPIVLAVLLVAIEFIKFRSYSNIMLLSLAYFVVIIFSTYINKGNIHLTLINICPALSMCLFSDYCMRTRPHEFARNLGCFLTMLIFLDLSSIFVFPDGMYTNTLYSANWILGFKTQRANIAVTAIALLATESYLKYGKIRLGVWLTAVASILSSYLCESTGGMIGEILEVLFLITISVGEKFGRKLARFLTLQWTPFLLIIIVDIMITVLNHVAVFEPLIVDTLGKDISFTGRTVIWAESINLFFRNPVIGCGFLDSIRFIQLTGNYGGTQPHNLFLAILVYSGIFGLLLFAVVFFLSVKNCTRKHQHNYNGGYIFRCCIIASLVIGITSMNAYTGFTMASMIILYHYCKIYH